ncbi:MAG: 50S ribosomal protein L35 [Planctomycetota bacterium]
MPRQKPKTRKCLAKRFKVTKRGKVLRHRPGRRHLLSGKSAKRRRKLRKPAECSPYDTFRVLHMLGQG